MPRIGIGVDISARHGGAIDWSSYWTTHTDEYSLIYQAMTVKPTVAEGLKQQTFVQSLVSSGVWAKLDRLFVFNIHTNANGEALIDWIHPSGTAAVLTNGAGGAPPVFTAYEGFQTVAIAKKSIINTQYNPATHGVHFTLNQASMGCFLNRVSAIPASANRVMGNHGGRLTLSPYYAINNYRGTVNSSAGNNTNKGQMYDTGLFSVIRKDANTTTKYVGSTSLVDEVDAVFTSIPSGNITLLSVEGTYFDDCQISMAYTGGLSEADLVPLKSAWDTYFAYTDIDALATIVNDVDDDYAHESQILIQTISGIDLLLIMYMSNKVSTAEWQLTGHALLKVFTLSTMTHLKTFDLFYPGLVAGVTMPADEEVNVPRMFVRGTSLICVCGAKYGLYTRSITITDSDPDNWTPGNISLVQMTMKDAAGDDVVADVTSANINIHLDYVLGDNYAGYHNLMPLWRNLDNIAKDGDNWYSTMQFTGERSHTLNAPTISLVSTDGGVSWSFGSIIGYTIVTRLLVVEPSIALIGTTLHVISRASVVGDMLTSQIYRFTSVDNGVTWVQADSLPSGTIASKPCMYSYGSTTAIAIQLASDIDNRLARTTMGIYTTAAFASYIRLAKIAVVDFAHYPTLFYHNSHLYMSYTKGIDDGEKHFIAVTRVF